MPPPDPDGTRPSRILVRGLRSTVGRESTTFGFSILVTVVFALVQSARGTPRTVDIVCYALGAVMSFTVLEALLSRGFRSAMPQHRSGTMALGTSLNFVSVGLGLAVAWWLTTRLDGLVLWGLTPFAAGIVYLVAESIEAAVAERVLKRSGHVEADQVED